MYILFISYTSKITLQLDILHNMIKKGIEISQVDTYSMLKLKWIFAYLQSCLYPQSLTNFCSFSVLICLWLSNVKDERILTIRVSFQNKIIRIIIGSSFTISRHPSNLISRITRFTKVGKKLVYFIHYNKQPGLDWPIFQIQHQIILCLRQ